MATLKNVSSIFTPRPSYQLILCADMLPRNPAINRGLPSNPRPKSSTRSMNTLSPDAATSNPVIVPHRANYPSRPESTIPSRSDFQDSNMDSVKEDVKSSYLRTSSAPVSDHNQVQESYGSATYASWIRTCLTTAAETLTINVSKSWASEVTTSAEEETPPGHDSRLTRVMKTYYLGKARDEQDLPAWLFGDQDRPRHGNKQRISEPFQSLPFSRQPEDPNFIDLHDSTHPSIREKSTGYTGSSTSIATRRLREMSARKRGGVHDRQK